MMVLLSRKCVIRRGSSVVEQLIRKHATDPSNLTPPDVTPRNQTQEP